MLIKNDFVILCRVWNKQLRNIFHLRILYRGGRNNRRALPKPSNLALNKSVDAASIGLEFMLAS